MADITYSYVKKRSAFGRQPLFCEQGPEMCDSIMPNPTEHKLFILRNPVHEPIQHTLPFSQHEVNTIRAEYTTTGINHAEGGWPKDVNDADPEQTQRYRRRIEKDDDYIHCINAAAPGIEHCVLQNNAVDLYETYFTEMNTMPALEKSVMRITNVYHDPEARPVSSICWQPYDGLRFAVSYVDMDFYRIPRGSPNGYIWDVDTPSTPFMTFIPPAILMDLQYNPKDKSMLVGGLVTGQVALFDARQQLHVGICPPHVAHRDMARNVLFINSKSGMEFFSSGPDGACRWWDARNLSEPTDEMIIDVVKYTFDVASMATANGCSVMEYEHTIPTRFMVGTDNGLVINGNRKGKTALERLPVQYEAHSGSVCSLERNPYFLKNFLTVGDWRLLIWSEDCRESPIISTAPMRHKVTAATWSPTRCSMLFCTSANGYISAWDLLRCQYEPVTSMYLCEEPLVKLAVQKDGVLVAVGSKKGKLMMVELSENMRDSEKHDKVLMTLILERESKREKILEARLREIRLKLKQAEESSPRHSTGEVDHTIGDHDLIEAANEYMSVVKKELNMF